MRIAVAYNNENGDIFQHFGRSEFFKIYDIQGGAVTSEVIIPTGENGHDALAGILAENSVDIVICGGIGAGAQNTLASFGIEVCGGASGNADEAVCAFLNGELVTSEATCNHHEEGHCGEGGCGSHGCGEGHGCGECGHHISITGPNVGKTCRVHYTGTFNDGTQFDSSYDRGETLEFICGAGMMIRGFDTAVANMEVGQTIDVHLMPEEAYGNPDPNAIITLEISQLPGSEDLKVGEKVYLYNNYGQPVRVTVTAKDDTNITFDSNHEMAGKELNFRIELVEVE